MRWPVHAVSSVQWPVFCLQLPLSLSLPLTPPLFLWRADGIFLMSAKSQHNLPDIWLAIALLLPLLLLLLLLYMLLLLLLLLPLLLFVCFFCAHNKMGTLNACQFAALWEIFQANRVGFAAAYP